MLDDLKLDAGAEGHGEGQGPGAAPSRDPKARRRTKPAAGAPSRLSRSASPAKSKQEAAEAPPKRRHYDAESVRQYIARQQEERRKKLQEERRAQREEAERKNQRLQELYRKQREGVARGQPANEGPAQKRLQETYTKLLLEQARLGEGLPQAQPTAENLQVRRGSHGHRSTQQILTESTETQAHLALNPYINKAIVCVEVTVKLICAVFFCKPPTKD